MRLTSMLYDQTGSEKCNMAASKPQVPIFQLVDMIGKIFYAPKFMDSSYPMGHLKKVNDSTRRWKSKIASFKTEISISQPVDLTGTIIHRLPLCFRRSYSLCSWYSQRPNQKLRPSSRDTMSHLVDNIDTLFQRLYLGFAFVCTSVNCLIYVPGMMLNCIHNDWIYIE